MHHPKQQEYLARSARRKRMIGAALLAVSGATQAADATIEALQKQVNELKAVVQQLQAAQVANNVRPSTSSEATTVPQLETATKADIEGLRTDIENYKYEQKRNRETTTALTTRGTTVGGSIQARAGIQSPGTKNGTLATADNHNSSFDIPQATFILTGSLFRDYSEGRNLDYRLAFAYSKTSPVSNNSNFNLTDAYLRYSPLPTLTGLEDPRLNLTLGQQQIPFGLEAQTTEELRPVINNAQFLNGFGVGTRQIGFIARGDYDPYVDYGFNYRAPLLEYALGVVNGSGVNKSDDNNQKDWIARLAYTLPVDYNSLFRELKIGTSLYKGKKNLTRTVSGTSVVAGQGRQDRYGVDVYYNHPPFGATYEYVEGRDAVLGAADVKGRSHTLTTFYTWGEQWVRSSRAQAKYDDAWPQSYQLFARYDSYDPNVAVKRDKSEIYTLGFNWFFAETTKFQLNYNHYRYQSAFNPSVNELLAQFQFGF